MPCICSLNDLLGLLVFSRKYHFLHDNLDCLIIAWAEDKFTEGNDSVTLLILASLGLDNQPERTEVELYLSRYMIEQRIVLPPLKTAALVWIKLFMSQLSSAHPFMMQNKKCIFWCVIGLNLT